MQYDKFISFNIYIFLSFIYLISLIVNYSVNLDFIYNILTFFLGLFFVIEYFFKKDQIKNTNKNRILIFIHYFFLLIIFLPLLFSKFSVLYYKNIFNDTYFALLLFFIPLFYRYKKFISLNILAIYGYLSIICEILCISTIAMAIPYINNVDEVYTYIGIPVFIGIIGKCIGIGIFLLSFLEWGIRLKLKKDFRLSLPTPAYISGIILFIITFYFFKL